MDGQTAIAKVLLIVGFSMAMAGGGDVGKISQLTTGLSEVDKTFAGLYFPLKDTPIGWRWAFALSQTYQVRVTRDRVHDHSPRPLHVAQHVARAPPMLRSHTIDPMHHPIDPTYTHSCIVPHDRSSWEQTFPAMCRVAFEGWAVPESSCGSNFRCLAARSGDGFLQEFGYEGTSVALNLGLLMVRWLVYISLAWLCLEAAARGWTLRGCMRDGVAVARRLDHVVAAEIDHLSENVHLVTPHNHRRSSAGAEFATSAAEAPDDVDLTAPPTPAGGGPVPVPSEQPAARLQQARLKQLHILQRQVTIELPYLRAAAAAEKEEASVKSKEEASVKSVGGMVSETSQDVLESLSWMPSLTELTEEGEAASGKASGEVSGEAQSEEQLERRRMAAFNAASIAAVDRTGPFDAGAQHGVSFKTSDAYLHFRIGLLPHTHEGPEAEAYEKQLASARMRRRQLRARYHRAELQLGEKTIREKRLRYHRAERQLGEKTISEKRLRLSSWVHPFRHSVPDSHGHSSSRRSSSR